MGSQEPSAKIAPEYDVTDGPDAIKILALAGITFDPWQADILNDWMARDQEGLWASSGCGISIPRQNGKTRLFAGKAVADMIMFGGWIIYTAHLQKTATETFNEVKDFVEKKGLKKRVKEIKSALGREQIFFTNGARMMFVARTRNGGRGLHGDCLIFDEAQELTSEQQASFIPALAASKNPQILYGGTPPDENCVGTVFRDLRAKALNGDTSSFSWTEFSVEEIGDVSDHKRWAKTNPALGRRIKEKTIETELEQIDEVRFARERLGWWAPTISAADAERLDIAILPEKWEACGSEELKPEGKTAFGVKFSADGATVSLCGAVIPEHGPARISLIKKESTAKGIRWLADFLNDRYAKASCVVIDGRNGVELLVDMIAEVWKSKLSIIRPTAKDVIASASLLVNEINEQRVTWYMKQETLDDSARTSSKRQISGGWGFGGENSGPIEAASLALWGAKNGKRNPKKKMRIG